MFASASSKSLITCVKTCSCDRIQQYLSHLRFSDSFPKLDYWLSFVFFSFISIAIQHLKCPFTFIKVVRFLLLFVLITETVSLTGLDKQRVHAIAQLCPALCDPMGCCPPGPLSMEFSRQEY